MAYATLSLFKLYRGISDDADDAVIEEMLHAAEAAIDRYTGRTFEATATSTRVFDAVRDVSSDRKTLYLDADLCEVTTVTNGEAQAVTEYVTEPVNDAPYHALRLKGTATNRWTYSTDSESAISVRGLWAYAETAPYDIQQAALRLANYMYSQKDVSTFDVTMFADAGVMTVPQGMPRDVQELLKPYRRIR
jgi:hypothetical protein